MKPVVYQESGNGEKVEVAAAARAPSERAATLLDETKKLTNDKPATFEIAAKAMQKEQKDVRQQAESSVGVGISSSASASRRLSRSVSSAAPRSCAGRTGSTTRCRGGWVNAKARLHDTIKDLNRRQRVPPIRFRGEGTGTRVG